MSEKKPKKARKEEVGEERAEAKEPETSAAVAAKLRALQQAEGQQLMAEIEALANSRGYTLTAQPLVRPDGTLGAAWGLARQEQGG